MFEFLCHGVNVTVTGQLCRAGSLLPSLGGLRGLDADCWLALQAHLCVVAASTKCILTVTSDFLLFYTYGGHKRKLT